MDSFADTLPWLASSPPLLITLAAVLGLVVGSFLNVVIHRLPLMLETDWRMQAAEMAGQPVPEAPRFNLVAPRSACPACGHQITALENIPVISWLVLRGRCSDCGARISMRYPIVEAMTGLLCAAVAWHFGASWATLGGMILVAYLVALTFIDADTQLLPDSMTLPLLWIGLLFNLGHTYTDLTSAVIGAMAGYGVLWSIYWLFKLVTGKEGMGYGDFKLLAALGAWMGWQMLPAIVLLSSIVGAVVGIALMLVARHGREVPIPFGPYLAGAGVLALFFGPWINSTYLGFL